MDPFDTMMTALRFNEKINLRDLEGLVTLMTPDHIFIDSEDEVHEGRELMREGWKDFFERWPDYRNIFNMVQVDGDLVVMRGYSVCSYKPLDGPSLWTARVRVGLLSEWRVYKDTSDNRRTLGISH